MSDNQLNIYLRAFEPDDYLIIHELRKDDENWEHVVGNKIYVSSMREKKWVEEKIMDDSKDIYWAICLKENDKMIGYCSINDINWRNKNCLWGSIVYFREYRGKGYSIEAGFLMQFHVFSELGLHRFYAPVLESHSISRKMLKTLGFTDEGTIRDGVFKNNKFHNLIMVSVLKHEYEQIGLKYLTEKGFYQG
jgi:RimJ/RimL family protein N-acetyltransferase